MGIQLNKSYVNAIQDCALVDVKTTTYTWSEQDSETILNWIAHSHWDITLKDASGNLVKPAINEYLKYLDAKLSAVRKTATFWDAYNIRESASTPEEFIQKYAALPNSSSLVINTSTINIDNNTYNRGDIVIKDNYGNQILVPNEQSGVYYPFSLTSDASGNMQLSFQYAQEPPSQNTTLEFTPVSPSDGALYNYAVRSSTWDSTTKTYEIDVIKKDNKSIIPFWECREYITTPTTKIGSRIFNLISLSKSNDKWIFTAKSLSVPFMLIIK